MSLRSFLVLLAFMAPALAGCVTNNDAAPAEAGAPEAQGLTAPDVARELVILTHESFYIGAEVIKAFEDQHNAKVRVVPGGDAGQTVNLAILNKDRPLADLLFGIDNSLFARAAAADLFDVYKPAASDTINAAYVFDDAWRVTPVDYGYVNINFDVAALEAAGLAAPADLKDLTKPEWRGKFVVENPATSSPGLAFLLATVAHFGTDGAYTYVDYWNDLKANGVKVAQGWSDAYFTHFSGGGYGGDRPLVVSYTTSPPYAVREACTIDGTYVGLADCPAVKQVMPTANADVPGGAWLQIEAMGVLKGAKNADLAKAFIDHALTPAYQSSAAFNMFVYPVTDAPAPDFFGLVAEPTDASFLPAADVTKDNVQAWLAGWSDAVIG